MKIEKRQLSETSVAVINAIGNPSRVSLTDYPNNDEVIRHVLLTANPLGDAPGDTYRMELNRDEAVAAVRLLSDAFAIRLSELWGEHRD